MKRIVLLLAVISAAVLFITGCGGGGGETKSLTGTITDIAENPVPGAEIYLDGHRVGTSLVNGTYKITSPGAGPHNIEAKAMVNNHLWVGTRAVTVYGDGPTMNMNMVIGKWDELADIEGTVTDASNHPIMNARVIAVARYPQDKPADEASLISKVATTDINGYYKLADLPASITKADSSSEKIIYDVIASSVGLSGQPRGFDNFTKSTTLDEGYVHRLDFALQSSSEVVPSVPSGWTSSGAIGVVSFTVPSAITSRAAENAYDAVKFCISDRTKRAIILKRKTSGRGAPSGSTIENDVSWYSIWNACYGIDVPSNLAGFALYRGITSQLEQTGQFRIDFFRDPAIVNYSDASGSLTPGVTYWYGVAAISTSYLDQYNKFNPDAESAMSYPASVTPLGKLAATYPTAGGQVQSNSPEFQWSSLQGAGSYRVFIYDAYPIMDTTGMSLDDPSRPAHLPNWGQSSATSGNSIVFDDSSFSLNPGQTYWWVVIASNDHDFDSGNAYAISDLRSFVAR